MNQPLPTPPYFDEAVWGRDTWPLLSAAYAGDLDGVSQMLDEDPVRIRSQFGYYEPLHYAVRGGHLPMVELLLKRGADPKAEGWSNRLGVDSPLTKARDRERDDMVAVLSGPVSPMAPVEPPPRERTVADEFERACFKEDYARVEQMLAVHPGIASAGLYEAVHHARMKLVRLLFDAGADVNAHNVAGCWFTPLMHALRYKKPRWELAEMLLERGALVDSTNGLGMTPLHIVVLQGETEAAQWLLDRGAKIDAIEPEFGSTPLGWAARWGLANMAELLLDRGANPKLPEEHSWAQPYRWAEKRGHDALLSLLRDVDNC